MDFDIENLSSSWETIVEDVETLREDFEQDGWDVFQLDIGDVTPKPNSTSSDRSRIGFEVVIPDNQFGTLEELVEDGEFTEYNFYGNHSGEFVEAVLLVQDVTAERLLIVPLISETADTKTMLRAAKEEGAFSVYLRPLAVEYRIEFPEMDPDIFGEIIDFH